MDAALRDELIAMATADQAFRREGTRFQDRAPDDLAAERARGARIAEIVEQHGWPGRSLVGDEAASAAWLLVQHSDRDPDFQARALGLLDRAVPLPIEDEASLDERRAAVGLEPFEENRARIQQVIDDMGRR
jgi:hypothetical protein